MARRAIASLLVFPIAAAFSGDRSAPVRPLDPLTAIFKDRDYPKSARKVREQGTVAFRLMISRAGRIDSCTVTASSGSAALDAATCRILRARARFEPARDAGGRTIPDSVVGKIHWRLPGLW